MRSLLTTINDALPLKVRSVTIDDPVVTIGGEGWALAIACPWKLDGVGRPFDWETSSFEDVLEALVGHRLQEVEAALDVLVDPIFRFDGDIVLAIRADTDLDPWVLHIAGLVLVGRKGAG